MTGFSATIVNAALSPRPSAGGDLTRWMWTMGALMCMGLTSFGCAASEEPSPDAGRSEAQSEPIRGVWLTNIDSDLLFSDESIRDGLRSLRERGFNTIYPVVWNDGYTLHPSEVMAEHFGDEFRQDTLFRRQGRDPLLTVVREAGEMGLRVIPWFEFGFSSSYRQDGGHILNARPDWAARDLDGGILTKNGFEWMNALHPDVQDFMIDLILEVARRYDVDGIQGDDRLPAMPSEGGYSDATRALHLKETGREVPSDPREPAFLQWKADKLSDFAERLYGSVKAVDPTLTVSMAPSIHPWSKEEYLQDWPEWLRRGVVDELLPQAYRWDIEAYRATVEEMVSTFRESVPADRRDDIALAPGIIIRSGSRYNGYDYVRQAIELNRSYGVEGEVYFFYEGLFELNANLADSLFKHHYQPSQP